MIKKVEYIESIQRNGEEKELLLQAMREKRKNCTIKKKRNGVSLNKFIEALKILDNRSSKNSKTAKFNASRDRIALFILYFSGLRVSNLLLISLLDIEVFFIHGSKRKVEVPVIK